MSKFKLGDVVYGRVGGDKNNPHEGPFEVDNVLNSEWVTATRRSDGRSVFWLITSLELVSDFPEPEFMEMFL